MELAELKTKIGALITQTKIKENATAQELENLKTYLELIRNFGSDELNNIAGGVRYVDCYL